MRDVEDTESRGIDPARLYHRLFRRYGPQHWWPADNQFEVILGAILTQNTAWGNVEKALSQLREQRLIALEAMLCISTEKLAKLIRPAGFYRRKSACIKAMSNWLAEQGGIENVKRQDSVSIRKDLLNIPGIGSETADAVLLYALAKCCFVVDAYTRRILSRVGLLGPGPSYSQAQQFLVSNIDKEISLYQQYHALLVAHAKAHCRKTPLCGGCPLFDVCRYFQEVHKLETNQIF